MKRKDVLSLGNAVRVSKDKYQVPGYKRSYSEKEALERVAKDFGAKNYKDFQNAQRLKKFKQYDKRAEKADMPKDKEFFKDFFTLRKAKFKGKIARRIYSKQSVAIALKQRSYYLPGESP